VGAGTSSGLGDGRGAGEGRGLGEGRDPDGATLGVGTGRAVGRCDAGGDAEAGDRSAGGPDKGVVKTRPGELRVAWTPGAAESLGAFVALAVSGVGTAPTPIAIATPAKAAANPSPVSRRDEMGRRYPLVLAGARGRGGGNLVCRPPLGRAMLASPPPFSG